MDRIVQRRRPFSAKSTSYSAALWLALSLGAQGATHAPGAEAGWCIDVTARQKRARQALEKGVAYLRSEYRRNANGLPGTPLQASGSGGSRTERWGNGHLGNNALALTALLRCGVPETDPAVAGIAAKLHQYVTQWGVPDATWDAAWLAAAFANLRAETFEETRSRLLMRILDAQLTENSAKGMWGPLCIDTKLLDDLLAYEKSLAGGEDEAVRSAPPAKVAQTLEALTNFYPRVTQQALRFRKATRSLIFTDKDGGTVRTEGLPYAPYNQVFADLESTALAVLALSEAARNGHMPTQTARPTSLTGRPIAPSERSITALGRAADAIAARARDNGQWDACNLHGQTGPFSAYDGGAFVKELTVDLASEVTFGDTAAAFSALLKAARAAGPDSDSILRKHAGECKAARGQLLKGLPEFLASVRSDNGKQTYVAYRALLHASQLGNRFATVEIDEPDACTALLDALPGLQNSNGSWGARPQYGKGAVAKATAETSSLRAWRAGFKERTTSLTGDERRKLELKLLDYMCEHATQTGESSLRLVSTSLAMLCLADLVVPRIAGYVPGTAQTSAPRHLQRAVAYAAGQSGQNLCFQRVRPEAMGEAPPELPLLTVEGRAASLTPAVYANLARYVESGGTLVITGTADTRISRIELPLRKSLPKSSVGYVANRETFMDAFKGARPSLRALYLEDKRLGAVFLPQVADTAKPERGQLTSSQATQTIYLLLRSLAGPGAAGADSPAGEPQGTKE